MNREEFDILVDKQAFENYVKDIEVYKEKFIKAFKGKTPRDYAQEQFKEMLPQKEKSPNNFFWIAINEKAHEDIGYIWYTIRPKSKMALLSYVIVKEEFRNQGFGTEMIQFMERNLIDNFPSVKRMILQVFRHNKNAKQLYKKLGFWVFYKTFAGWNMTKRLRRNKRP